MFLINKTERSGLYPERPVWSPLSFKLPVPLGLAIVLLTGNMAEGTRLCRANPGPLLFRHDAIGLCPILHLVDVFLLLVQPVCFSLVRLPTRNSLIDPLFLIRLALIDHGCFGLGKGHPGHQQRHPTDCKQYPRHRDLLSGEKLRPLVPTNTQVRYWLTLLQPPKRRYDKPDGGRARRSVGHHTVSSVEPSFQPRLLG